MTDQQENLAGVVQTRSSGHDAALSIELNTHGVLIVDTYGTVRLLPWHEVIDVSFAAPPVPDFDIPKGHEGSE